MALIDRLVAPENEDNGEEKIVIHVFTAAMNVLALGIFTRAQVVTALNMSVSDEVQLDLLVAHYQALNNNAKREFFGKLESLGILLERGYLTKAQFVNALDL